MKYWMDLHIHSCLSPCANEDMTPNNIVNMAAIKGLDIIAVTDHNSAENAGAVMEAGKKAGILVVPGMELCTSEEIHLVCLFPELKQALKFDRIVYERLLPIENREDIFGSQIMMDADDRVSGREKKLLAGASTLDTGTAVRIVKQLNGVVIPAHVNRESFSMLNTLGTIPEEYGFYYLECPNACREELLQKHPELAGFRFIHSSDAHFLQQILEREFCLELSDKSADALLKCLL